jgi:hypothetical protein
MPDSLEELIAETLYTEGMNGPTRKAADAVLTAIEAAGFVVVPKEPTSEMLDAVSGYLSPHPLACWQAMIAAATAAR